MAKTSADVTALLASTPVVGVETHRQARVAAAVNQLGRVLGSHSFPPARRGMRRCAAD